MEISLLMNYQNFFTSVYLKLTLSSFWYALIITGFTLLIAYPTAYWLTKTKHKQLWLLLIIIPSWINLLLKTYAFIGIFGVYGPINQFLERVWYWKTTNFIHGLQFHICIRLYFHSIYDTSDF